MFHIFQLIDSSKKSKVTSGVLFKSTIHVSFCNHVFCHFFQDQITIDLKIQYTPLCQNIKIKYAKSFSFYLYIRCVTQMNEIEI